MDENLLEILGCPLEPNRPPLRMEGNFLICTSCGYGFPVRNGIPDLLPESGISPDKLSQIEMENH